MVNILNQKENKNRPTTTSILIPFSLHSSKSLKYQKLPPPQQLNLSVLKLDGSSFSFHVARNATVAELRIAMEEQFSLLTNVEGDFLWQLVWSHFCLCYGAQMLNNDKANISTYGIRDGDQLKFIHHLRMDNAAAQHMSKNHDAQSENGLVFTALDASFKKQVRVNDHDGNQNYFRHEQDVAFSVPKAKLAHSLKELLLCSKLTNFKHKAWKARRISFSLLKS